MLSLGFRFPARHWPCVIVLVPVLVSLGSMLRAGPTGGDTAGPLRLTLDEAVLMALQNNAQILDAEQQVERARGEVIEVRAEGVPKFGLFAVYQQVSESLARSGPAAAQPSVPALPRGRPSASASVGVPVAAPTPQQAPAFDAGGRGGPQDKAWQISFQARHEIYTGGRVRAQIKFYKLAADSSLFKLREAVDRVISDVRKQFYEALYNRALITVQEESVRLLTAQLADQQNRFDVGLVPRFNVLQAEVALANARPALIQARNNYHISVLTLARTLGLNSRLNEASQEPISPEGTLRIPEMPISLALALQVSREQRPSLKVQRQNILMETENINIAASGYRPTLEANGGYKIQNSPASRDLGDTLQGWFVNVVGSWNVFDGFETFGKLKQARARLESAHVNYDDSVRQVELEVHQAWAKLLEARETLASQQKTLEQALEAVRLAGERLRAGAGTQLDLLNSTVQLTQSQGTELQARFNYNAALAELDRSIGADTKYTEPAQDPLTVRRGDKTVISVNGGK